MQLHRLALAASGFAIGALVAVPALACENGPRSLCAKSVVLGKAVPGVIVFPAPGVDTAVPMGLTPFVTWDAVTLAPNGVDLFCAQPTGSTLTFDLTCTELGTGTVVGPFTATSPQLGVPATPGLLPVPAGFSLTIPAGTLATAGPWSCTIAGSLEIEFPGTPGVGATSGGGGNITGVGDVEVCLVEPSPVDPSVPRLDFYAIDPEPVSVARRGDQVLRWYSLINNDPEEQVVVDLSATSTQTAHMPQTPVEDLSAYNISSDVAGTDAFPLIFGDELLDGALLDLGDPMAVDDQEITRTITLEPGEIELIPIVIRSHGMCADGSCSEVKVDLTGTWDGGDDALACGSAAVIVDDVPATTPQCEITDTIQAGPSVDARWGAATFDADPTHTTFSGGNLHPGEPFAPAAVTTSSQFNSAWPEQQQDAIRVDAPPQQASFTSRHFAYGDAVLEALNTVTVVGLDAPTGPIIIPSIHNPQGPSQWVVNLDVSAPGGQIVITAVTGEEVYNGPVGGLLELPPEFPLQADFGSAREFQIDCATLDPSVRIMEIAPRSHSELVTAGTADFSIDFTVLDPRTNDQLAWGSTGGGPGVSSAASGDAATALSVGVIPGAVPQFVDSDIAVFEVTNADALNSPILLPVAVRQGPVVEGDADDSAAADAAVADDAASACVDTAGAGPCDADDGCPENPDCASMSADGRFAPRPGAIALVLLGLYMGRRRGRGRSTVGGAS